MESEKETLPKPVTEPGSDTPVFESQKLMVGGREAVIVHNGVSYRLRITANDRLILTK